ncbi:MAG: hypothetical protein ABI763_03725 [Bacteroidota bacterium]
MTAKIIVNMHFERPGEPVHTYMEESIYSVLIIEAGETAISHKKIVVLK